eukprot:symbB.v1.2.004436.t1/scaffold251.1/size321111/5
MDLTHSNPQLVPQELGIASVEAHSFFHRLLCGFQEGVFQEEVENFVQEHACHFAVLCMDGSYPLHWQQLHQQYKELFDQQLEAILWFQDSDKEKFLDLCHSLEGASAGMTEDSLVAGGDLVQGVTVGAFRRFMSSLTATEDFERFLEVMFAAATGRLQATLRLPEGTQVVSTEMPMKVPEGLTPGDTLPVSFLGHPLNLTVPEGYQAGMTFPAVLEIPRHQPPVAPTPPE